VFYKVYNQLGFGFLEKVYENVFTIKLRKQGFVINQHQAFKVFYDDIEVGNYFQTLKLKIPSFFNLKQILNLLKFMKRSYRII